MSKDRLPPDVLFPTWGRGGGSGIADREWRAMADVHHRITSAWRGRQTSWLEAVSCAVADAAADMGEPLRSKTQAALVALARVEVDAITRTIAGDAGDLRALIDCGPVLAHAQSVVDSDGGALVSVARDIVRTLAHALPTIPAGQGSGGNSDGHVTRVPLLAMARSPAKVVNDIALAVLRERATWTQLGRQIHLNLCRASDVDPDDDRKRPAPPSALTGTAEEVAVLTFADTPLLDLLLHPVPLAIPLETRFEHTHICAGSGWGKTQYLQHLIVELLDHPDPPSLVVLDSQGDMLDKLARLAAFAPGRGRLAGRLVVIDPRDITHPPALNLFALRRDRLDRADRAAREQIMNGVIELYETLFGAILGADITQKQGVIFRYLARLMLAVDGATIHTLREVLEDPTPFIPVMESLEGSAAQFFRLQFHSRDFNATKQQILRRLWGILEQPTFERMFSTPDLKLDLFDCLQQGRIVLVNTAKDFLKTERSSILGRVIVALTLQATLERAAIPPSRRRPAFLILDEAHEVLDASAQAILEQARKYRLGLVAAHQHLDQLSPGLAAALAANTAIKMAGGVSDRDAHALARELRTTPQALHDLRKGRGAAQFMTYVSGLTAHAIPLTVPFGTLEALPRMSDAEHVHLLADNRRRYAQAPAPAQIREPPQGRPATAPPPPPPRTTSSPQPPRTSPRTQPPSPPTIHSEPEDWDG